MTLKSILRKTIQDFQSGREREYSEPCSSWSSVNLLLSRGTNQQIDLCAQASLKGAQTFGRTHTVGAWPKGRSLLFGRGSGPELRWAYHYSSLSLLYFIILLLFLGCLGTRMPQGSTLWPLPNSTRPTVTVSTLECEVGAIPMEDHNAASVLQA